MYINILKNIILHMLIYKYKHIYYIYKHIYICTHISDGRLKVTNAVPAVGVRRTVAESWNKEIKGKACNMGAAI